MADLFWSLDSLVLKGNVLSGFGWAFHARDEVQSVGIRIHLKGTEGDSDMLLNADVGKPREDVAKDFPDLHRASYSGFVVFCAFPAAAQLDSIALEVQLSSGMVAKMPIPRSRVIRFDRKKWSEARLQLLWQFAVLLKRGLYLVREGQFATLFEKSSRYLKGRPTRALNTSDDLVHELPAHEREKVSLVIDHDLGGGANQYRERMVASKINAGNTVLILSYHVATLSYMLIVRNTRVNFRLALKDSFALLDLSMFLSFKEILYNTAVSFARPEEIPKLLMSLKQMTQAPLKVFVHDFFSVCPSHFLLDHTGAYCHIPDVKVCATCLPINQQGLCSLFVERDIKKWRAVWGAMLISADNIVAFSNNTVQLLKKAYPQIQESQLSVVPHGVEHLGGMVPSVKNTAKLCIGIVGQIGFHKGASIVQAIAQEIKRRAVDIKIVVIGVIEKACEPSVVRQTGPYQHDELPRLIETSGANVMLFPSVWPETFSYVVQELIEMQLPVAAFNLGAPAERLHDYARGKVLVSTNASDVLDELIEFHRHMYLND